MQSPRSLCDEDKWGHYNTRLQGWHIERRHLHTSIDRARASAATAKATAEQEVGMRARSLATNWGGDAELQRSRTTEQAGRATQESIVRMADHTLASANTSREHACETAQHLGARNCLESRDRAMDRKVEGVLGSRIWGAGVQRGAREFALERTQGRKERKSAVQSFQWAKADEVAAQALRQQLATPLPAMPISGMGPNARETGVQFGEAKSAAWRDHLRHTRERELRSSTAHLDHMRSVGASAAQSHYGGWRLKVDARTPATTYSWPDQSSHRVRPTLGVVP